MNRAQGALQLCTVNTAADLASALEVRRQVFVDEQGVSPELEVDEFDQLNANASHAIARRGDRTIAAGRLRPLGTKVGKLERLAVLPSERGQGIGRALTRYLEQVARERGIAGVTLNSQRSACGFYEKLGYTTEGDPFVEAGIEHVAMHKPLV